MYPASAAIPTKLGGDHFESQKAEGPEKFLLPLCPSSLRHNNLLHSILHIAYSTIYST
jgi:hypothetical protein